MLPLAVIQEVRRLLDEGELSQRGIARKLDVSRGTVSAIANGRRGIYGSEPPSQLPALCCWDLPPQRCVGCGAKVYLPCVLCRAREYRARHERMRQLQVPHRAPPRRVA